MAKNRQLKLGLDLSEKAQAILDQVLEGESPERRAKVLRMVLEMGIRPEEEFFSLSLALKHLQLIMVDAPVEWKYRFSEFLQEVDARSETGRQMLGALSENLETIATLVEDVEQLRTNINELAESTVVLDREFTQTAVRMEQVIRQWQEGLTQWQHQRQQDGKHQAELSRAVVSLKRGLGRQPPAFLLRTGWSAWGMKMLVAYAIGTTGLIAILLT